MFEEGTNEVSQLVADVVKQVNGEFASGHINQIVEFLNLAAVLANSVHFGPEPDPSL
jgi:predicted sugar kinase